MITQKYGIVTAYLMSLIISFGTAWAGASNSGGGGMLLKDSMNPWFLQNTKEVHYCFDLNNEAFSLSRAQVQARFNDGIGYWKNEFLKVSDQLARWNFGFKALGPYGDGLQVGTQSFVEEACGPHTDLTVYLGTLPVPQRKLVGDFDRVAAITVRSAYNRQTLRAQGFIYIAPDLVEDGIIPKGMWKETDGDAFRLTLTHELGHIFGMPDSGMDNSLMSYNIVDTLIWARKLTLEPPAGERFSVLDQSVVKLTRVAPKHMRACVPAKEQKALAPVFGLPSQGPYCWGIAYHDQTLEVLMAEDDDLNKAKVVASAKLDVFRQQPASAVNLLSMWLPREQVVFKCELCDSVAPGLFDDFHFPIVDEVSEAMRGVLIVNKSGRTTPISLMMSPAAGQERFPLIGSVIDGNLEPDLLSLIDSK